MSYGYSSLVTNVLEGRVTQPPREASWGCALRSSCWGLELRREGPCSPLLPRRGAHRGCGTRVTLLGGGTGLQVCCRSKPVQVARGRRSPGECESGALQMGRPVLCEGPGPGFSVGTSAQPCPPPTPPTPALEQPLSPDWGPAEVGCGGSPGPREGWGCLLAYLTGFLYLGKHKLRFDSTPFPTGCTSLNQMGSRDETLESRHLYFNCCQVCVWETAEPEVFCWKQPRQGEAWVLTA